MSDRKHTLVVGGTRGIGRAVTRAFADDGHTVSVIARNMPADNLISQPAVRYWRCDVSRTKTIPQVCNEIIRSHGPLDNLVFLQRFRSSGDDWMGDWQVSLTATKILIEYLKDHFRKNQGGAIVLTSSVASQFIATEQPVSYHVVKAGLVQLVRYYAVMLGAQGIRVNAVSPASLLKEESKSFYMKNKKLVNLYKKLTPLGRMGTAEELADVVKFLCSEKSSFITGQDIWVDGGVSLTWHETLARKLLGLEKFSVIRKEEK